LIKLTERHEKFNVIAEQHDQRLRPVSLIGYAENREDVVLSWRRVMQLGAVTA
jgi:hypothetical protein